MRVAESELEGMIEGATRHFFGIPFAAELLALYPVAEFPTPNDALNRVTTDWRYACAVQDFAERIAGARLRRLANVSSGHTSLRTGWSLWCSV